MPKNEIELIEKQIENATINTSGRTPWLNGSEYLGGKSVSLIAVPE
jgi:hypothetical protein